jgi:chemotaxis protein MotA
MARAQARGGVRRRPRTKAAAPARSGRFDFATALGLASGFGLVIAAMTMGGSLRMFLDGPAALIVVGGTLGVTTMCFSMSEMLTLHRTIGKTLFHSMPRAADEARRMLAIADQARRQGVASFADLAPSLSGARYLAKAIAMVGDGFPVEEMERVMRREMDEMIQRHRKAASVLRKAAEIAPAMGLIGTLIGLVQMLGNLDDPAAIGPNMAIALITTFYGAVLSNMVFAPMAAKLDRNSREESLVFNVYLTAAVSMARRENPRRLEMLLNAMLPPSERVSVFD